MSQNSEDDHRDEGGKPNKKSKLFKIIFFSKGLKKVVDYRK